MGRRRAEHYLLKLAMKLPPAKGEGAEPLRALPCAVLNVAIAFAVRLLLVTLFLPFSALGTVLEFDGPSRRRATRFRRRHWPRSPSSSASASRS